MTDRTRLRSVKGPRPFTPPRLPNPHPEFCLLAAISHYQQGHQQAAITAIADALWAFHKAEFGPMDDCRVLVLVRQLAGTEWTPPTFDDDEAA